MDVAGGGLVQHPLGEPKVEDLRPVCGEENVRRFDVAVDDARGVRRIERAGQRGGDLDQFGFAERSARQPLLQRLALQQLHDEERHALGRRADIVDGADVRVLQRGNRAGLALEPRAALRIARDVERQHLDGDGPIEPRVAGRVDFAHPARAEQRDDLVRAQAGAAGESDARRRSGVHAKL